ncbi:DUF4259 domain-containing protein [Actinoplanes sp. G11-F43]|uniref:DUF4259 domain-containing protein n=1 Tax=Actinoplanes sp. G11-F43 TaxID=3424130 RepID=UPI003D33353D
MATVLDPFDNDGAADLLDELRESSPGSSGEILEQALQVTVEVGASEYLEKDFAEAAVAAAALVAAIRNGDREMLGRRRLSGVEFVSVEHLVDSALVALDRVAAEGSELLELGEDEGEEDSIVEGLGRIASALRDS